MHESISDNLVDKNAVQTETEVVQNEEMVPELVNVETVQQSEMETPVVGEKVELPRCGCTRNKCAQAYCKCFEMGVDCDPRRCGCVGCKNDGSDQNILNKRDAYQKTRFDKRRHCRCSRNRCQQKYCPCFQAGLPCTPECQCNNCGNCME